MATRVTITIKVLESLRDKVDDLAEGLGITRSEMADKLLSEAIKARNKK